MISKTIKICLFNIYKENFGDKYKLIFNKGFKNEIIANCEWDFLRRNKHGTIYHICEIDKYPTAQCVNWTWDINRPQSSFLEIKYLWKY